RPASRQLPVESYNARNLLRSVTPMMKYRLVTPGPAMVPAETLLELAKPVRHHRTAENKALIAEAMELLRKVMMTSNDVILLTSSGTGAMETAVANFIKPGDT